MSDDAVKSKPEPAALPTGNGAAVAVCAFLALAVLAVFGQTAHFEFVGLDDPTYVYENSRVTRLLNLPDIVWTLTHAQCNLYHPLTMISLMLDYQFHGLDAGGYHVTNVCLHATAAILLFLALRQMTGAFWRSAFIAAVFALHPLRVESVAWISERKDVLAAFCFTLTLGAYVRYARKPDLGTYLPVPVCFGLALLCKPTVVPLPLGLLLLDYWPLRRFPGSEDTAKHPTNGPLFCGIPRRLLVEKIPLAVLAAAAGGATLLAAGPVVGTQANITWPLRFGNAAVSCVIYLRQTVWPTGLAAIYPYPEHGLPLRETAAAVLLLTLITAGAVASWRRWPWFFAGWFWYLIFLIPTIGIVQVGQFAHADRNTYLPGIGLLTAGTWAVAEWTAAGKHPALVAGCLMTAIVGLLGVCAYRQTTYWRNNQLLWTRVLACTSENSLAHNNLGVALQEEGKQEEAAGEFRKALAIKPDYLDALSNLGANLVARGSNAEAIISCRKALEIAPNFVKARSSLGRALAATGHLDQAIAEYRVALQTNPDDAGILGNLGDALSSVGKLQEAAVQYRHAVQIDPADEDARFNLGLALFQNGDTDDSIAQFQEALKIKPRDDAVLNVLGQALAKAGRTDEAIASYRAAVKLNSRSAAAWDNLGVVLVQHGGVKEALDCWQRALEIAPDQLSTLNNLAWPLATTPDAALRNGMKAVALAERARQLSGGSNPVILHTLAAAYAEAGRFDEAAAAARRALELTDPQKSGDLRARLEKEIALYRKNLPIRDDSP